MKKKLTYSFAVSCLALSTFTINNCFGFTTKTRHPLKEAFPNTSYKKNLFTNAKVNVTSTWSNKKANYINDGESSNLNRYWASLALPSSAILELKKVSELGVVKMWTYWKGKRVYQYKIEGSLNNKDWFMLSDQTKSTQKSTPKGVTLTFKPAKVKYVRITFTNNSAGKNKGGHIVEIEGYKWHALQGGLSGQDALLAVTPH